MAKQVTKDGNVVDGPKIKGVKYLSDEKRDEFLRENKIDPVFGHEFNAYPVASRDHRRRA